jgi:hypothetical protein
VFFLVFVVNNRVAWTFLDQLGAKLEHDRHELNKSMSPEDMLL